MLNFYSRKGQRKTIEFVASFTGTFIDTRNVKGSAFCFQRKVDVSRVAPISYENHLKRGIFEVCYKGKW